ncbi:hypothetical protein [Adhaeribacter aquaticus]|uniref:hypothetical protein n=1 Tax=Adhaeribacter aquaticus TaxID=299567 RepID=UPI00041F12C2|nr:hypothetical protein [Adhaeribacter aquaticus]
MAKILCIFISILVFFCSCTRIQNPSKYELAEGRYKLKMEGKLYNVYLQNLEDSLILYKLPGKIYTYIPKEAANYYGVKQQLTKSSLDVDVLTALFKIRPPVKDVLPIQFNTNFNGNVYVGRRKDVYHINYKKNDLGVFGRQINHFGFSAGGFIGMGNTAMNASTTANGIAADYDGLIVQKGIAGILAINKLTAGVSLGFDNLLDPNKRYWIYQNKPWFGLVLGLNLN